MVVLTLFLILRLQWNEKYVEMRRAIVRSKQVSPRARYAVQIKERAIHVRMSLRSKQTAPAEVAQRSSFRLAADISIFFAQIFVFWSCCIFCYEICYFFFLIYDIYSWIYIL